MNATAAQPVHNRIALVLSGGGARGAYETGVVAGMIDVLQQKTKLKRAPFTVFTGTSVGAINAAWFAAHAERADMGVDELIEHWNELSLRKYLRFDWIGMLLARRRRLSDPGALTLGRSLFQTSELEILVSRNIPFKKLHANIERGIVDALVISAFEVATARTALFAEMSPAAKMSFSKDPRRFVRLEHIRSSHILASAAIPFLFPARKINDVYYCDGGIRFNTPIAPAIRCGAERLVVVSTMKRRTQADPNSAWAKKNLEAYPSPLFLAGKMLNALLLDPVMHDLHMLERFNRLIDVLHDTLTPEEMVRVQAVMDDIRGSPYRHIRTLFFSPSRDIGEMAYECARSASFKGAAALALSLSTRLGKSAEADFASFILFDRAFATDLIALGRQDAHDRAEEIHAFFAETK